MLFGREAGSVHQEAVIGELDPKGQVDRHLHAFEEAIYVLEGTLTLEVGEAREELGVDDYVFIDRAVTHALRNETRDVARWFEVSAPQPGGALDDTVFIEGDAPAVEADPPYRRAHFVAPELPKPNADIGLAGFTAGNVGGAVATVILGPDTGSSQFNLMVVQYAPGGFITEHDHAFEEGFYFLEGEIEADSTARRTSCEPVTSCGAASAACTGCATSRTRRCAGSRRRCPSRRRATRPASSATGGGSWATTAPEVPHQDSVAQTDRARCLTPGHVLNGSGLAQVNRPVCRGSHTFGTKSSHIAARRLTPGQGPRT